MLGNDKEDCGNSGGQDSHYSLKFGPWLRAGSSTQSPLAKILKGVNQIDLPPKEPSTPHAEQGTHKREATYYVHWSSAPFNTRSPHEYC